MISQIKETSFGAIVHWSDEMVERIGYLRGNQVEIGNLLCRFFIEIESEKDRQITNLNEKIADQNTQILNLEDRICKLEIRTP